MTKLGDKLKQAGKEEIKNKTKSTIKKLLIKAIPFIAIILVGLMVASCLIALVNIIKETAQGIINAIVDFFKGPQTVIEISDEQLDQLIAVIEATGIDLEDLELLRMRQNLLRKMAESNTPLQATGHQICSAAEQRGI